ncbi:MAG: shikimate kinase, partial [Candidatus Omnitrophica bacterium]|nr:shikimate kinase [Candidatus Omnitrophota bacterium]MBU1923070.1 shikimate kinase [Candidatus Omnitrophota bacterium]
MKMNIYLVGFMGTGKSSVGCQLAKERGCNFVDLDELIELKEQRRIVDIFTKDGEVYFRKIEKKILKQVSTQKEFVVACGGGAVLDKDNIRLMKKTGIMVCLYASPQVILKRVSANNNRPLLNVGKPQKRIELLLKMRAPYYMQANKIIDTSRLSVKQVVKRISKILA